MTTTTITIINDFHFGQVKNNLFINSITIKQLLMATTIIIDFLFLHNFRLQFFKYPIVHYFS